MMSAMVMITIIIDYDDYDHDDFIDVCSEHFGD